MALMTGVKDIGEVYTRLLDHRPFLQGEIKYFVKEFEGKRSDREIQRLFEILESVTTIRETQVDRVCRISDQHLCALTGNLEVAMSMCNKILAAEDKINVAEDLSERRQQRQREWNNFSKEMHNKTALVDQAFQDKEKQIIDCYRSLQEKLESKHVA
ncbi:biogenesis of lysosome-related organelles complex 1 subunit 5-like [Ornithodoros turicata]